MKLIIVSGRSGSGKSTALNVLEDLGFYCIDNLPTALLLHLVETVGDGHQGYGGRLAVSIDARNLYANLQAFPEVYEQLKARHVDSEIIFVDASDHILLKRFNETRRKHPLTAADVSLKEAISKERQLLEPIVMKSDLIIDTSELSIYQLRDTVKIRVAGHSRQNLSLLIQSFGYKHGLPLDSDFVFDVRCLPNPYWDKELRSLTGRDTGIKAFLEQQPETDIMYNDIRLYLEKWLPKFQDSNRSYVTISIGCTGGHHRSVYIGERLGEYFQSVYDNVQVRHKELASQHD